MGACSAETLVFPNETSIPAVTFNVAGETEFSGISVRSLGQGILVKDFVEMTMQDVRSVGDTTGLVVQSADVIASDLTVADLTTDPSEPTLSDIAVKVQDNGSLVVNGLTIRDARDGINVVDEESFVRVNHGNIEDIVYGVVVTDGIFEPMELVVEMENFRKAWDCLWRQCNC